ncbi:MAG: preprotein translocase subunit YajC [Actinomycetota bacterium]|nr:preprotein translocase subunit YajC [Actinomycetota bacterium]
MEQGLSQVILLGALIAVFYFLLIRPQKKRVEQHQKLVGSVDVGDEIITIGGLYGRVTAIGDDDFELEPAEGTRLRFVKSAIARRVTEDLVADEEQAEPETSEDPAPGGAEA